MSTKIVRFGIVGAGLMGREFASAAARWCHLIDMPAQPEIVAVCDPNEAAFDWFKRHFPGIRQYTRDYRDLIANPEVQAVYCATPHHLHADQYSAVIEAGKHLFGEKPFGIDLAANRRILKAAADHPESFVRCSTEFIFFPAVQRLCARIEAGAFGRLVEVNCFFLHSSDLNPDKPINWKRMIEFNGEYGCMGDLGMHVCSVPFRAGWIPRNVRAMLSKIVKERPDGKGGRAPCRTWDNAILFCEAADPGTGESFPLTFKTYRIAPGEKNTWGIEVLGTKASARFSTKNPKRLELLEYGGGEQAWQCLDTGYEPAFKAITGSIFEFGFPDAIQQMWAAYLYELVQGKPFARFAACMTPDETALSHRLFTAALRSQQHASVEKL